MTRSTATALCSLLLAAVPAAGQVSEERVRLAVHDATRGLGQALAGGSPLVGPAATTGGLGGFSIAAAGTLTGLDVQDPTRDQGMMDFVLPTATVNAAIGIVGSDGPFGGLDAVGRAGPVIGGEDVDGSSAMYAAGVRFGVLNETTVLPAVSATLSRAWADGVEWNEPEGDEVWVSADVATWSIRADVSKKLLLLTPYAGAGWDRTSVDVRYRIPPSESTNGQEFEGAFETSAGHAKAYAGASFSLLLLSVSAEVGRYKGGSFAAASVRLAH